MVAALEAGIYPGSLFSAYLLGAGKVLYSVVFAGVIVVAIFVSVYNWPGVPPPQ